MTPNLRLDRALTALASLYPRPRIRLMTPSFDAARILESGPVPIDQLRPHPDNPNHGDVPAIIESLREHGQYRAVIIDQHGTILAGHHVVQAAARLGWQTIRAERLQVTEQQARKILLADNRIAELGDGIDSTALLDLLQALDGDLTGTGYTATDLRDLQDALDDSDAPHPEYTRDITIPHYEPRGDSAPPLSDLMDRSRTIELEQQITAADIPPDVADVLRHAAQRHTVIDFHRMADYYAHAPAEVQRLMEAQALVIVDVDTAIAGGYVRLSERMADILGRDREDGGK